MALVPVPATWTLCWVARFTENQKRAPLGIPCVDLGLGPGVTLGRRRLAVGTG
jgi:hypothetical protein